MRESGHLEASKCDARGFRPVRTTRRLGKRIPFGRRQPRPIVQDVPQPAGWTSILTMRRSARCPVRGALGSDTRGRVWAPPLPKESRSMEVLRGYTDPTNPHVARLWWWDWRRQGGCQHLFYKPLDFFLTRTMPFFLSKKKKKKHKIQKNNLRRRTEKGSGKPGCRETQHFPVFLTTKPLPASLEQRKIYLRRI